MNYYLRLLLEAFVVGIVIVILGYLVGFITKPWFQVTLSETCKGWNKKHIMEVNLFLVGFIAHLFFEFIGVNKWYCTHGTACRTS
jgi:nitrate reductase gamma subunit